MYFDFAVIDAQKLIRSGCHVDIIWLSLSPFLIEETVYRVVFRRILQQGCHDSE